jgi:hypothetical protein
MALPTPKESRPLLDRAVWVKLISVENRLTDKQILGQFFCEKIANTQGMVMRFRRRFDVLKTKHGGTVPVIPFGVPPPSSLFATTAPSCPPAGQCSGPTPPGAPATQPDPIPPGPAPLRPALLCPAPLGPVQPYSIRQQVVSKKWMCKQMGTVDVTVLSLLNVSLACVKQPYFVLHVKHSVLYCLSSTITILGGCITITRSLVQCCVESYARVILRSYTGSRNSEGRKQSDDVFDGASHAFRYNACYS